MIIASIVANIATAILLWYFWSRIETLQKRIDALERKSTLPKHDPMKSFLTL